LEAVRESLGVTADQAKHLLETNGLPNPDQGDPDCSAVAQAIVDGAAEPFRNLVRQLDRTLAYFHAQRRTLVPTKIVLTGGGAAICNVDRFLGQRLELPVATWQLPSTSEANDEDHDTGTSPLFASAVGLSILSLAA
jgi:Tfp pilus assembly PilM family ATPase